MSSEEGVASHYEIIGVNSQASTEEIRKKYQSLILRHHPDKNGGKESPIFNAIQQSWKVLSDSELRSQYDASIMIQKSHYESSHFGLESKNIAEFDKVLLSNNEESDDFEFSSDCHRCGAEIYLLNTEIKDQKEIIVECDDCSTKICVILSQ